MLCAMQSRMQLKNGGCASNAVGDTVGMSAIAPCRARKVGRRARPCRVGEEIVGPMNSMTYLMKPEMATFFSACIAVSSVGLNLYGTLFTEKRKSEIQREVRAAWQAVMHILM